MKSLLQKLQKIPAAYKPIPFWSWNDALDIQELKRQIHWMQENGIGGFFMHARGGLKTPYLSKAWMDCIEVCCDEANKLGMHAWAYDENGWPSGFVGGKLLEEEANRDMYILPKFGVFDPAADVSYCLDSPRLIRIQKDAPCPPETQCLNLYLHRSPSTVDILNPKVVDKFLALTHGQYKARLGDAFSQKLKGFFTDEPQYYRWDTPYTPMVKAYFAEQYQEDLWEHLGLLFVEKEGFRTFRYRYWLSMQKLMLENFAKKVFYWCDENDVQLTGHYVEEASMGLQIMCCAGVMPFYQYQHIPGIDYLGPSTINELSSRQLGSAARQLGKKHAITETFGCCGWDISPADLQRIVGFQYACGVNLMCHHLIPYSEHGQRKRDYPAHYHPMNPWIKDGFKAFNDRFSKLGYLLAEGEEVVNVAMLHPIRSAYFDYQRDQQSTGFHISQLEQNLQGACRTLSSHGIQYHFLDETLLEEHGFTDGDEIGCGLCRYRYLVLPDMLTMGAHTEALLRRYIESGGKVLLLGRKPAFLEGEPMDYPYLQSNFRLEDLLQAQPFTVARTDNALYYAYRQTECGPCLFVQNASADAACTQTFHFPDTAHIHSFTSLDLLTLETCQLPLTVTLPPNGSLLLFPSQAEIAPLEPLEEYEIRFQNAEVTFQTNYCTLSVVRYSKDGIHYSAPMRRSELFQMLLQQRYQGDLWLKYDFEIQTIPETLTLISEKQDGCRCFINGQPLHFDRTCQDDPAFQMADVSHLVKEGNNAYEVLLHWHQSEDTYYALFGQGVTEGLRNCIAYDSEIEDVYLAGHFGVYSHGPYEAYSPDTVCGHSFYIGEPPKTVSELTTDGFPFFRGKLTLRQKIILNSPLTMLKVPGRYQNGLVRVNGIPAGDLFFQHQLDLSACAKEGENLLEIEFTLGNRNLMGPFFSEKDSESLVYPSTFDAYTLPTTPQEQIRYKLARFYPLQGL